MHGERIEEATECLMLSTMVSSAGEINPAPHQQDVIFSPVPHSNASTPPNLMSSEYHPVYGHLPPECAYYGPGPDSYQYCESYPHPHMCAVSTEYGKESFRFVFNPNTPSTTTVFLLLAIKVMMDHFLSLSVYYWDSILLCCWFSYLFVLSTLSISTLIFLSLSESILNSTLFELRIKGIP